MRSEGQTVMFVAIDGEPAGLVGAADPIKETGHVTSLRSNLSTLALLVPRRFPQVPISTMPE